MESIFVLKVDRHCTQISLLLKHWKPRSRESVLHSFKAQDWDFIPFRSAPTSSIVKSLPGPELPMPPNQPQNKTAKITFWTSLVHMPLYLIVVRTPFRERCRMNKLVVRKFWGYALQKFDAVNFVLDNLLGSFQDWLHWTSNSAWILVISRWGSRTYALQLAWRAL